MLAKLKNINPIIKSFADRTNKNTVPFLIKQSFNGIHFIGIGGIGISAIARMALKLGKKVSGSDSHQSLITNELKKLGAKIHIGHNAANVKNPDLIIYTTAINPQNPELKKALQRKIPALSYPEILGLISKEKFTIAVAGCHGKTTTTAMVGTILKKAGLDPTIIVGSLLKKQKSNFVAGLSEYLVAEACEYQRAFLNLKPKIAVITNIEADHLDYYKNLKNVIKAFGEFAAQLKENEWLVCDSSSKTVKQAIKKIRCQILNYRRMPTNLKLKVVGQHNLRNAQAAFAVSQILKIKPATAKKALKEFNGVWRRYDYKGKLKNGALIYDDYAHHPTEIKATLKAAKKNFSGKKIICVFQPHLFSRTKLLIHDFAKSFQNADLVIIADIYAAREKNTSLIHSRDLIQKIKKYHKNAIYLGQLKIIKNYLRKNSGKDDVIFTMGAGDIYKVGEKLLK